MIKKILTFITAVLIVSGMNGCARNNSQLPDTTTTLTQPKITETQAVTEKTLNKQYANMTAEEIVSQLTLEEKVAQMMQPAGSEAYGNQKMEQNGYGSLLGMTGLSEQEWNSFILRQQNQALKSSGGIPFIYGNDHVHGVNTCTGTVIFPHNIGIGAANDTELTYKMGLAVADEAKLTKMLWSFSPCVASAQDPRWGRTYESYSSDINLVKSLSTEFSKGMIDGGILPCAKHFLGDGETYYGTGGSSYNCGTYIDTLIDRGDAVVDEARLTELLSVYKSLIDVGVKTVMITHNSVNGTAMHADKHLITDVLKGDMGFDGFVVSDWESIHNIPGDSLKEQIVTAVNAGIDMFMEPFTYAECQTYILEAVNEKLITEERINDAVKRIISVKIEMGLFDDPLMENLETKQKSVGSDEYRNLARELVEKSLVLLKNENDVLPLKRDSKIFVTGPAANDTGVMCGGWTFEWAGRIGNYNTYKGKTILDGFKNLAEEYGFTIITDLNEAESADITILCVGEKTYAEWEGDTSDLSLTGSLGLDDNKNSINTAKELGKPTITLIVAGRNVIYDEYEKDWDAVVMCYLPGSEGDGIANVISGKVPFMGKLPMPYYSSVDDIRTDKVKFQIGYGLN